MEQMNRIELKGNVGNIRVSNVGENVVANFSLATNYVYKSRDGQAVVETTWFSVVAWGGKGMPDFNKLEKGMSLSVSGRMRNVHYTAQDGTERQGMEVVASRVAVVEPYSPTI